MTTPVDTPVVEHAQSAPARSPAGPVLVCAGYEQAVRWRPGERLQQLFEERCDSLRAAGQGDQLAVDAGELTLTFDQLDARANQLARRLLAAGARPGDRIGLLFDQGVHAYAGMLAVLKLHAAYVPLDAGFPPDRLAYIVQDAEVGLVLSQAHLREHLADVPAEVLCVDQADTGGAGADDRRLTADETGPPVDDLCYIIYTSGSTGRPKGVAIDHASICNFVRVAVEIYGLESWDRVYQGMTVAFDFSVEEIWVPLLAGATLVPKPGGASLLGRELWEFLRAKAVTALCCVPTLLATLDEDLPDLSFLLVSGEACPQDLIARWHKPGRWFLNVYGPTEATVTATWTSVDPARPVTIGVPLPTYSVVILDPAQERALPFGELGEIGVAGIGLARGYVHRDDLTERAFIPDFLGIENNSSGRIYRTGDLGRVNDQGEIEYHGRIDTQVKIRGYRIELAEIEAVLRQVPGIAEAVVDTHEPEPGELELVAYYSPRAGAAVDAQQVVEQLREHLPGYMVPAYLEELAVIPRLPSDKVDRKRLPPPTGRRSLAAQQDHVEPATGTEQVLAEVLAEVVRLDRVSVDSHFFADLGANSLLLARFCARVRQRSELPSLSMREVYLHPTVRSLAAAIGDAEPAGAESPAPADAPAVAAASTPRYLRCGALQLLVGLVSLHVGSLILVGGFRWLFASTGWVDLYLRSLAFTTASFLVFSALPIAAKWALIGRWKRQELPVWSLAYVRFWFVKSLIRANPMRVFVGSPLYSWYLRALGAKVGRRVAIFSGSVPVCTDLLTIGDGTVIRKDASFTGYRAHAGRIQTGAVTLGRDVLVGEQTVLDIEASMGDGASLGHSSSLHPFQAVPAGQSWHGSPAQPATADYRRVAPARCGTLRRVCYSTMQLLNLLVLAGPLGLGLTVAILPRLPVLGDALSPASLPYTTASFYGGLAAVTLGLFLGGVLLGLAVVTTLPRVANLAMTPNRVYPLYGFFYWLERVISRMTNIRFFTFLFGDSSAIVHYLRAIGYDLSRIEQTGSNFGMAVKHDTPFLSTVGTGTMVSDGLSIINADYTNSSFRVSRTTIGPRSFLGNNIAYPSGGRTGENCLLATKVMVPLDGEVREGVGLLGSPPFQIPRSVERDAGFDELKQGGELGRRLAAKNRHNAVTIAAYLLVRWVYLYGVSLLALPAVDQFSRYGAPLVTVAACLLTLFSVAYFVLVDRAVTRFRALQPRFCSIYDPYFWWHERYWKVPAMAYIGAFSGTPFKNLIWRLLGVRLGRRVFDDGCWMTERTLVAVGDDCTLNALSTLQSHSLEDGTFKSDHITIGAGCTVGINAFVHYGVTMGDGAVLEADAFLMKGEELAPHARWSGNPASERRDGSPEPAFPVAAGGARLGWETRLPAGLEALPVATTPPYGVVGVSPSIYLPRDPAPPYARRDADEPLDRALAEQRFVLVVGGSKAGKSRTAFEAVRRRFPASQLVVPVGGARAAAELLRDPPPATGAPPAVLWLDGLDRFLGDASGFDRELLGWLQRPDHGLVVVATIDARRRDDLRRIRGGIGWAARRVVELATEVPVPARLSPAERAEAQRHYPEVDLARGIGEALSAAEALELRYELGTVAAPVGRALVQAAVDWHRTGTTVPISEADLRELSRGYLPEIDPTGDRRADADGLAWACQPVAPGIALLAPAGRRPGRFLASGHLVALADRKAGGFAREVDPAAWALAVARATPEDAVRVGFGAYASGNPEVAAAAWSRASASGHPEAAPWAAVNLGLLRQRLGDVEGAAAAFEQARASGHPEAAPWAAVNLGLLNGRQGEVEAAAAAFEQARASGHPDAAPWAAVNLGLLRRRVGDVEGAAAAFEEAIGSGRADAARCAHANLRQLPLLPTRPVAGPGNGGAGGLLAWRDVEAARRGYEQAIAAGDPDAAPRAAIDLGVLLAVQGDVHGARLAFARAASSGHPEAPWAVIGLGLLLEALGDLAYARDAYRYVAASGHAQAAPVAHRHLEALAEDP
jgi:non-ribosomal peptide synthetase-like protein